MEDDGLGSHKVLSVAVGASHAMCLVSRSYPPSLEKSKVSSEKLVTDHRGSYKPHVKEAIIKNVLSNTNSAPLAGLVFDMFCSSIVDVGNELGVSSYLFFTCNADFLGLMLYLPGRDDEYGGYDTFVKHGRRFKETKGIIVNNYTELEAHAVKCLLNDFEDDNLHHVYTVGPLIYVKGERSIAKGEKTNKTGLVYGWTPQKEVLAHKSVGAFVSHCGWNSILESLWFGVPTVTWPMYVEQQINAFQMVRELGLGVELRLHYRIINGEVVVADEIARAIKCVMESDNEVRKKVKEKSEKSRLAVMEGGSSYAALGDLIDDILRNKAMKEACS
ncbi:flavonol 3-O-glucosyltransferase UGT71C4-like [Pistacia vera]|uniref:flavonol 3-O-glucosyltransferase UGT71C4-like n=1 Tax=Pistacia vera TaxID=55513 RepID=UPI0012634B00|nr:flavonol 3-O-glucosyltransferase UGT71C4-like [Pistacia vera]